MRGVSAAGAVGIPTAWLFLNPMPVLHAEGGSFASIAMERFAGMDVSLKNAVISTGGVFVLGITIGAGKFLFDWCTEAVKRKLSVRVEFDSRDDSFRWVLEWLAHNKYAQENSGTYIASSNASKLYGFSQRESNGQGWDAEVMMTPGEGTHWLSTRSGKWVFITRSIKGSLQNRQESITVAMLGSSRSNLDAFIEEARELCKQHDLSRTLIYVGGDHGSWNMAKAKTRRSVQSVILDKDKGVDLLKDIKEFVRSKQWYVDRGIPWRRGYLLYGPPGSGKTSFVTAVAGEVGMNIYTVSLGSAGFTDDSLQSLMNCAPQRSIILMEDIDAAFVGGIEDIGSANRQNSKSLLSLSGLLNAIDGVASQEGSILFLTTNNLEALPARLVRSGRIDVQSCFSHATKRQARDLFVAFFPGTTYAAADVVQQLVPDGLLSMSDLQSIFTRFKNDPDGAIQELKSRFPPKSE